MFVLCIVCCQVEVSARSQSLVQQESYQLWSVVVCVIKKPRVTRWPWKKGAEPLGNACSKNST
jgi:hypothetical protein